MKRWGVLIVLSLSMFIIVIDTTIMNVSIAALVEDLDTTVQGIQAAISLYALVMAAFMLPAGKLSDILGKKRTFSIGVLLFGIGTFTASISQNLAVLIIGWLTPVTQPDHRTNQHNLCSISYNISKIPAAPWPVPIHMVTMPYF